MLWISVWNFLSGASSLYFCFLLLFSHFSSHIYHISYSCHFLFWILKNIHEKSSPVKATKMTVIGTLLEFEWVGLNRKWEQRESSWGKFERLLIKFQMQIWLCQQNYEILWNMKFEILVEEEIINHGKTNHAFYIILLFETWRIRDFQNNWHQKCM